MHRADDQDTLDLIRAFMSMHTTLVLIGVDIPGSGLLREGRHDPRTGQWILMRSDNPYSPGLRQACEPLLRSFTRTGGQPHARRNPIRHTRFGPEHIPAFLPKEWYDRHFCNIDGVNSKLVRRTAAVRLGQIIAGGSLGDAAQFLGINLTGKQYVSAEHVHRWAHEHAHPRQFDAAPHALVEELDASSHLVDYQHRRESLSDWALHIGTWHAIILQLPPVPGPISPNLGNRKRQEASAFVWARVTQGEPRFAPRPVEAQQPEDVRRHWLHRRGSTWFQLSRPDPLNHYAALRKLLSQYADQLAKKIDSGADVHPVITSLPL